MDSLCAFLSLHCSLPWILSSLLRLCGSVASSVHSPLQEALLHLATDAARTVPSLHSTLLSGLLPVLPRLGAPCAPLMAKLLGHLIPPTKPHPHTHLRHRGDRDSEAPQPNSESSSLRSLLAAVEESLPPTSSRAGSGGAGAVEGLDGMATKLKLGSLRVLGLLAFAEGAAELLGPVSGALEQWAKFLRETVSPPRNASLFLLLSPPVCFPLKSALVGSPVLIRTTRTLKR